MPVSSYTFKILLEGKDAIAAAKQIRAQLEKELGAGFDFRQAKQQMADVADLSRTTGAHVVAMGQGFKTTTGETGQMVVDLEQADDQTRQMISDLFRAGVSGRELEQALRGGGQAVEETREQVRWLGRDLEDVAKMGRLERFGAAMTAAARQTYGARMLAGGMGRLGTGMMATGMAVVGPSALAGRRWIEYTRDVSRSARAMGLAREESEILRQELIAQSETLALASPEQMAEGLYQWATGVGATARNQAELKQVIEDTIPIQEMAYMQGVNLAQATEITAGIMGEFGLAISETERVVDVLDTTADRTFAQVMDLGEAFKMVGPIANQLGVSVEETAAAFGILSDANIRGTRAGRAMRQHFIRLSKTTKAQDEALNKLFERSEELGQGWRDLAFPEQQFVGLAKWIDLLAAGTEKLTQQERAAALATIATANELPALTQLVERQISAREHGINIIRAEAKILEGNLDEETAAYARWEESITGKIMNLLSAHEARARKVESLTEEESYQIDQLARKWDAAMLSLGQATMEMALPAIEELTRLLGEIAEYVEAHPEVAQAAVQTGAILAGLGAFVKAASVGIRLYADWQMVTAAATMLAASENMLTAAGVQATTGGTLLTGLGGILAGLKRFLLPILAVLGGFEAGRWVSEQVRGEEIGAREALGEIGTFVGQLAAMTAGTGGMITAALLGEDPAEGFEIATYEAAKLFGLIEEEMEPAAEEVTAEMLRWERALKESQREAQGLGSDLADLSETARTFSQVELEAIDEIWEHARRRNEMIERQNEDLIEMQERFLEREAELHERYLDKRADLEEELRQVAQDPLWQMTRDVQKSEKRIADAIEDYNKRISDAIRDHQRRLRNLQEGHDDKMEDLEARRDAKGIIAERRRYGRAVRDANEHHADLLESAEDRLNETIETEREKITTMRRERREDLEEKLRELDENYLKESQKRKEAYDKAYADRQQAQARELQQLERAHAERLAKIMHWEMLVRDQLRRSYIGREADLRAHLQTMEAMYRQMYNLPAIGWTTLPMTGLPFPTGMGLGLQAGGYATRGYYSLGEAGSEYVLSAPTTRALERAIGHLSQAKILSMAGGSRDRIDVSGHIHVTADPCFSPEFIQQIEAGVQRHVIELSTQVARSSPGAYRPH